MRHPLVKVSCLQCGKSFMQRPGELAKSKKRGKNIGMFCSRDCSTLYNVAHRSKPEPNCKCAKCGALFYRSKSRMTLSKSGLFFCNKACKDKAQSFESGLQEIWPDHYGEGKRVKYRKLAINHYGGRCQECGLDTVEILIVHHKDGNRDNNAIANLEVLCPNHHAIKHCKDGHFNTKTINGATA